MWSDVQKYVQECQTCQTTNDAKFQKSAAPLHPIPVKSKVWNQVLKQCVCVCACVCVTTVTSNVLFHSIVCITILIYQVGIDLVGPLPKTQHGNRFIITLVDFFSKWPEAEALPDKSAKSVSLFLYKMMCRYNNYLIAEYLLQTDFLTTY